ncbi:MAG: cyclic nucleotide-binding domain-containing protein [Anaerolineales bacterium]|nr:cyclic nucleotide-binding domain-containing protein [Anaerolineales bacterium]
MAIKREDRIAFLKQRQMFNGVDDEFISDIAKRLEEYKLEAEKVLFKQGDPGSVFYFIYEGSVRVWGLDANEEELDYGFFEAGDKFGEESLITGRPRSFSITTLEETTFLVMHAGDFEHMLDTYPSVDKFITTLMNTRRKTRQTVFPWLHPGEIVQILTRRHPIRMIDRMFQPLITAGVGVGFLYISYNVTIPTIFLIISVIILIPAFIWMIWVFLDWRNDYFILTNQRVIWLEQIIFQAAARQEAPLAAVQSVDVKTTQLGRILDYGDVLVRTFTGTGSLKLTTVNHPKQMKGEIEELLMRVRKKTENIEEKRLRQSIRRGLGLEAGEVIEDPVFYVESPEDESPAGFKLLRTREVSPDGKTITYHRHWWVLLSKTWFSLLLLISLIALLFYALTNNFTVLGMFFPAKSFITFWFLGILGCIMVIAYHSLDWYNDIYKITKDDKLIDSEKKPFGEEISRTAPIRNIISLEHNRKGILRLLLNFGMVKVVVADETLIFYDVHNPAQVQQDIYYRQEQIKLKQDETEMEKDRAHISRWLRAYHEIQAEAELYEDQEFFVDLEDEEEDSI